MKKILLLAIIGIVGFFVYNDKYLKSKSSWGNYTVEDITVPGDKVKTLKLSPSKGDKVKTLKLPPSKYKCDGRQHCSQMTSRAEAEYFIRNCPNVKMDGDHDGIPCENDSRF